MAVNLCQPTNTIVDSTQLAMMAAVATHAAIGLPIRCPVNARTTKLIRGMPTPATRQISIQCWPIVTVERSLERAHARVALLARSLEGVSPLAVLARGYSLTRRPGETAPVVDADGLAVGDEVETRLSRGAFLARVLEKRASGGAEA